MEAGEEGLNGRVIVCALSGVVNVLRLSLPTEEFHEIEVGP